MGVDGNDVVVSSCGGCPFGDLSLAEYSLVLPTSPVRCQLQPQLRGATEGGDMPEWCPLRSGSLVVGIAGDDQPMPRDSAVLIAAMGALKRRYRAAFERRDYNAMAPMRVLIIHLEATAYEVQSEELARREVDPCVTRVPQS